MWESVLPKSRDLNNPIMLKTYNVSRSRKKNVCDTRRKERIDTKKKKKEGKALVLLICVFRK